jgi:long-chain acyl-CoA synthetase
MQEDCCRRYGERPMYGTRTEDGYHWTHFREFAEQVNALRSGLASLGIGRGDKVAIIADNCVEWAVGAYATYGLGAHYVPMYESQHPKEREYIIRDSEARAVLVRDPLTAAELELLVGRLGQLQHVVALDSSTTGGGPTLAELMTAGRRRPVPSISVALDDIAGLVYTSGTTGHPKGVVITHSNLLSQIESISTSQELFPDDRSLSLLPWGHLMGQIVEVHLLIYCGTSAAILGNIGDLARDIGVARPTIIFGVPRVFTRIHDGVDQSIAARGGLAKWLYDRTILKATHSAEAHPKGLAQRLLDRLAAGLILRGIRQRLGGRLRFAFSGAASLNAEVIRFFDLLGIPIYEGYGLTETTMAVTLNGRNARRIGSVGRCLSSARIVLDPSVAAGQPGEGEIVVYGPCITPGYHKLPEETARALTGDGGLRTGDIGRFDEDGYLYITGRVKEIYKLENGRYVAPAPLEEALQRSPLIAQVMVYGDNRAYNIAVVVADMAALRLAAGDLGIDFSQPDWPRHPRVAELYAAAVETQGAAFKHFERPRKVLVVNEEWTVAGGLLTPTLKIRRRILVDRYRTEIEQLYVN